MTPHTPTPQAVGATMTRVGSGVAALLFVSAATLLIPMLLVAGVLMSTGTASPRLGSLRLSDVALTFAAAAVALVIASLGLVTFGRRLDHH